MTDAFSKIRECVPMLEVVKHYGFEPNRGFIRCPFHNEKTPSLKIYERRWKCFGCGEGGSAIDFTALLFGLTVVDAARRLIVDFHLNIPLDREPTAEERRAARKRQKLAEEHRAFEQWRELFINRLNAVYRRGHLALQSGRELTGADAEAVCRMAQAEYYADTLSFGTPAEQAAIFRERGAVQKWIDRILNG